MWPGRATECRWEYEPGRFLRPGRPPSATARGALHIAHCIEWANRRRRVAWMMVTGHISVNNCGFDKATVTYTWPRTFGAN